MKAASNLARLLPLMAPMASTGLAPATTPSAAGEPAPAEAAGDKIGSLRFLVGRWRGSGRFESSQKAVSSTMRYTPVANGNALSLEASENAPNTFSYAALITVGTTGSGLTMMLVSNNGGPSLYRSAGWVGGRLVFEADHRLGDGPGGDRFTYKRGGSNGYSITYEYSRDGSTWRVGDRQSFVRAG